MTSRSRVICPYCGDQAELVTGEEVYGKGRYAHMKFWACRPCLAWVGVHKDSKTYEPLGRLANKELRQWKRRAHETFDPMWHAKVRRDQCSRREARTAGYKWLADALGIPREECHIGMFNVGTCKRVVEICSKYRRT